MQYAIPDQDAQLVVTGDAATVWRSGKRIAGPLPIPDALKGLGIRKRRLPLAPTVRDLAQFGSPAIHTVPSSPRLPVSRAPLLEMPRIFVWQERRSRPSTPPALGFDLGAREQEVRNMLFKLFRYKLEKGGFDHEEAVQEVMLALAIRNRGRCPWDANKSSWGHYVYMVIDGTLCNMARKAGRRSVEVPDGLLGQDGEEGITRQDLQIAREYRNGDIAQIIQSLSDDPVDRRIYQLLGEGVPTREVATALGLTKVELQVRLEQARQKIGVDPVSGSEQ